MGRRVGITAVRYARAGPAAASPESYEARGVGPAAPSPRRARPRAPGAPAQQPTAAGTHRRGESPRQCIERARLSRRAPRPVICPAAAPIVRDRHAVIAACEGDRPEVHQRRGLAASVAAGPREPQRQVEPASGPVRVPGLVRHRAEGVEAVDDCERSAEPNGFARGFPIEIRRFVPARGGSRRSSASDDVLQAFDGREPTNHGPSLAISDARRSTRARAPSAPRAR